MSPYQQALAVPSVVYHCTATVCCPALSESNAGEVDAAQLPTVLVEFVSGEVHLAVVDEEAEVGCDEFLLESLFGNYGLNSVDLRG